MRVALLALPLLLGTTLLARADTKAEPPGKPPAPAGKVPMTLVPCLPGEDDLRLAPLDGEPVVCWGKGCMQLVEREPATLVAPPPDHPAWPGPRAEVVERDGKTMICLAADCSPVGAKLATRVAGERKRSAAEKAPASLAATADRKVVVVADEAWNVAADKRMKLKKPASYTGREDTPNVVDVEVAGNLLVVSWSNCAGPCTVAQLVDDGGKNRGRSVEGGGPVFQLDDKRFVVMSEYAQIHVFDLAGKPLGSLQLGAEPNSAQSVALDDSNIGVLREDGDHAHRLTVVSVFEDSALRIRVERFLPDCAP